jgi:hypothetical protein
MLDTSPIHIGLRESILKLLWLLLFFHICRPIMAARRFPWQLLDSESKTPSGALNTSNLSTIYSISTMLSLLGQPIRIFKHRDLIGEIILLRFSHTIIMRQADIYFYIVRRRAAWASFVNLSASLMIMTLKVFDFPLDSMFWLDAASLIMFCTTWRSLFSQSAGHISIW